MPEDARPGDKDCYYDSEEVREKIRHKAEDYAHWPYDETGPGVHLPVRPDAYQYLVEFLCAPERGPVAAGGLPVPDLTLHEDGTLTLQWSMRDNRLSVHVPCKGIVRVERRKPTVGLRIAETYRDLDPRDLRCRLDALFDWVRNTGRTD